MPRDPWARLASPFSHDALAWRVAEVDEGGALARLAPLVRTAAVTARLDEVVGAGGWSFHLAPMGPDALVGNLTVEGATRAVVVRVDHRPGADPGRHADEALSTAALGFGMCPPVDAEAAYWVDYDPEAGEPLHLPDIEALAEAGRVGQGAGKDGQSRADSAGAEAAEPHAGQDTSRATPDDGADGRADDRAEARSGSGENARTDGRTAGAHEVIERLIERLREEGLGKEAALLVVRYQGYGRTPEESRELYGRLRALLLEKGETVP